MKIFVSTVLAISFLLATAASAQLPTGNNVNDAWYQGGFEGIRLFYGFSTDEGGDENGTEFSCRLDYYHDGRIRLLAGESYFDVPDSPYRQTTVFYTLKPIGVSQMRGNKLVITAYRRFAGPDLIVEPFIAPEDLFTKRCVPLLDELFKQIPVPEVKMFKDQYGKVFGVE